MSKLQEFVDQLRERHPGDVEVISGPLDQQVGDIRIVEAVEQVDEAPADAVLVLERGLSALAPDYRFDVLVRRAAARSVAALLVIGPADLRVSMTAVALARRAGVAVVRLGSAVELAEAIGSLVRRASDRLSVTVDRVRAVCAAIDDGFRDVDGLLESVGLLLGRPVLLIDEDSEPPHPAAEAAVSVPAGPEGAARLATERPGDDEADALLEMVLWRVAAEVTRLTAARVRAQQTTRRSTGEVLIQLVDADRATRAAVAPSARRLGVPIDDWHVLTRIELDNLLEVAGDDVTAYEIRDQLADLALLAARSLAGSWHVGHDPGVLLLLWTGEVPPTEDDRSRFRRQIDFVLATLGRHVPRLRMYCGSGTPRPGVAGLASTATEARLAVSSARFRRRAGTPVFYDAVGMRATLLEWYGSPTVQQSMDRLFAPLADLPPGKRQALIDTLATYLDLQGSAARAAEVLHLHRNAVRYRVQRGLTLLGIDEQDVDQRLFLHLACRAQRLGDEIS